VRLSAIPAKRLLSEFAVGHAHRSGNASISPVTWLCPGLTISSPCFHAVQQFVLRPNHEPVKSAKPGRQFAEQRDSTSQSDPDHGPLPVRSSLYMLSRREPRSGTSFILDNRFIGIAAMRGTCCGIQEIRSAHRALRNQCSFGAEIRRKNVRGHFWGPAASPKGQPATARERPFSSIAM
jgi:hypothetical protein